MSEQKRLVVIDGKSVFYRGYYAMPNLSTKDGSPTGGVFGFATMALEVIRRLKPDYVAIAWDKPKTNIRRRVEMYPAYKSGRKPAPPDFYAQVPVLHELLEAFGWPLYEFDDYEADDIMGTLAVQASEKGIETLLVTSDMDMLQLINDKVHVYALKTGLSNIALYSPDSFKEKYHIDASQFLDFKALKGDSSDNIPGVPGIGEKTAVELINQYGSFDEIYDNLPLIRDSVAKKLAAGHEMGKLSRELARIWTDAPMKIDLNAMSGENCQPEKILEILNRLEFRSLARQLPDVMQVSVDQVTPVNFGGNIKADKVSTITNDTELASLELPDDIFMHSWSVGKHGQKAKLLIVGNHNETFVLQLENMTPEKVARKLSNVKTVVGYDIKTALQVLLALGVEELPTVKHDVLVAAFLINPLRREQSLTDLAFTELGYEGSPFENLDSDETAADAGKIISTIRTMTKQQVEELAKIPKVCKLANDLEWPVIPVLAHMEFVGIRLDSDYLVRFSEQINDLVSDYEQQIYGYADKEFNISSSKQLADVLFETLKLPATGIKRGKWSYSTAASELAKLNGTHPIIDLITQYRQVAKLKNTYVDTLPHQVDANGRIHTTFNLHLVQTGRLSSTDPNLQNIPTRSELGRHIRTAFIASEGYKLVSADYSQFELRLAAVLSEDKDMIEMFNRGADIHLSTAAQVYGRDPETVTKQMRSAAKAINFGILYGLSPHGLAVGTGMNIPQATEFIEKYKALRPALFDYIERLKVQARDQGYVETLLGRRRPTPDVRSGNFALRGAAERAAINMPIQGTEADLVKLAMINAEKLLDEKFPEARMLLQVHDSILVEAPAHEAEAVGKLLKDTMEQVYKLPVNLDVDVTVGDNWGEL